GAGYAIKVPFYFWLDLQRYIRAQSDWVRVAPDVTGFIGRASATPWGGPLWVAIYRKKVRHRATKNFQLDLFDPNDGHYEYSAVTSNLDLSLANLWYFMCGRGNHEKDDRSPEKRLSVSYSADHGLCRQQCLAASRSTRPQSPDKFPDRY